MRDRSIRCWAWTIPVIGGVTLMGVSLALGQTQAGRCTPAYPTLCLPPAPPDLNCSDLPQRNFKVLPPDPHNLDLDRDGLGCELN